MDKNQTIGLILIGAILIGFYLLNKPSAEELERQKQLQDSLARVEQTTNISDTTALVSDNQENIEISDTLPDSLKNAKLVAQFGDFANAAQGQEDFIYAENDKMIVKFSTKGGRVYSVELKDYYTYDHKPLILFDGDKNRFNLNFFAQNHLIQTENLYFTPVTNDTLIDASQQEQKIILRAKIDDNRYLEYVYTLKPGDYLVDFDINFHNLGEVIPINTTFIEIYWDEYVKHLERGEKWERQNTLLFYKKYHESVEKINAMKEPKELDERVKIRWISYKQQFFNSTLIAKNYFDYAVFNVEPLPDDTVNLYFMSSKVIVPFKPSDTANIKLAYYYGPNKYSILKSIRINGEKINLEQLIPLGKSLTRFINKTIIIPLFDFLGKYISNYGIVILIMTLIIKLILTPLTYRSYASSAKMRILKPEIDKILSKIPKDKQMERQQATMDLYKKAGVNPMGGCLPMLLQFPILIALFRFFPASIELRQKSFLWVKDLSTYDAILTWDANIPVINWIFGHHISLFTLLMAVAMIINSKLSSANSTMDDSNPQAKSMKYMMYLMPLMMIVWFNGYSAGLSYYYFLSTTIGILQILTIRKLIDEDKVLAQLQQNLKSNKSPKKSKFQQRLEEMQKQQAKYNNKNRKK